MEETEEEGVKAVEVKAEEKRMKAVEARAKEEAMEEISRKTLRVRKRKDGKTRTAFYVEEEDLEFMRSHLELADARSMNEFVNKAIKFYIGFLKTEDTEFYQMHSLSSLLKAKLDASERRISNALFRMAVQVCILTTVLDGRMRNLSDEEFEKIMQKSCERVATVFLNQILTKINHFSQK